MPEIRQGLSENYQSKTETIMHIPFVDLHAQYLAHRTEIDAAIASVIKETAFIGGKHVARFEEEFASDYGVKHCVSVGNGTDAIYIALKMMGIGAGDEVITTAHSWISTSEVISQTGARPVFVDVDDFYTINADLIEAAITPKTRCIIPVHLYGQPANMTAIVSLCKKYGLRLVEDCAQAHYAEWNGQKVGTFGDVATFSFYPGKNLGAYGDAGAILTNVEALATKMRMYANHGALKKHHHQMEGINSRLDGLQAAILSAKLPHIHKWTGQRRAVAAMYDKALSNVPGVVMPKVRTHASHVYHLYVIQVKNRDGLSRFLAERGIQTAVHYPVALPLMPAYSYLGTSAEMFPAASRNQNMILSLPMYPEMTPEMVDYVTAAIAEFTAATEFIPAA
jgi:dTDP-4-amino-4,6-dideoxygalactose transaminase